MVTIDRQPSSDEQPPIYNYDHTSKQRQAKRRTLFTQMRESLRDILADPEATEGIKAKARIGLGEQESLAKQN